MAKPTCAHCKKPIAGHPAIVHDPALGAAGDTHYHREHLKHRPKNPLPKPVRGRRMSRAEEADAFGETELTDEATTPAQRAAYETERAGKRAREWYILHVLEENPEILTAEFAEEIRNVIIEGVELTDGDGSRGGRASSGGPDLPERAGLSHSHLGFLPNCPICAIDDVPIAEPR